MTVPGARYPLLHPLPLLRMGFSLGSTGWALAAVRGRADSGPVVQAWARRVLAGLGIEITLAGPIPSGAQLWVSNHLSWVDPLIYLSLRPCRILAKTEVGGYPMLGAGSRRVGLRFVRRNNLFSRAGALRTLGRDLGAGEPALIFPEGTTTRGEGLAPLHEGSLRLAYQLGVKLLAFRLDSRDPHYPWVGDASLLPHLRGLAWNRRNPVTLQPGPVLEPDRFADVEAWLRAIRSCLEPPQPGAWKGTA